MSVFTVRCRVCRDKGIKSRFLGRITDELEYEAWIRAPGHIRKQGVGGGFLRGVKIEEELRAQCNSKHRINAKRPLLESLVVGAVRVKSDTIYV